MSSKYSNGLIKIMFGASGLFLVILFAGLIKAPFVVKKMEGSNYLFSDKAEMRMFETVLDENEIPYETISDSGISIPKNWKHQAEEMYEKFMEEENENMLAEK